MGNVYVKDAGDFSSADQKNLGLYFEERKRGLAVFFPGIGYHTDKPLLYYGKKLAAAYGCEIMEMSYGELPTHIKGNHEKMTAKDIFSIGTISSIIALIIYFGNISVPLRIADFFSVLGDACVPLSMIVIGVSLAKASWKDMLKNKRIDLGCNRYRPY